MIKKHFQIIQDKYKEAHKEVVHIYAELSEINRTKVWGEQVGVRKAY